MWVRIECHVISRLPVDRVKPPAKGLPDGIHVRAAVIADLERLRAFEHRRSQETFKQWMERGYVVVVACREDRSIIGFHCMSRENVFSKLLGRALFLGEKDVISTDVYILPQYRGMGLHSHLKIAASNLIKKRGYTGSVGSVPVGNIASRRANRRLGAKETGWFLMCTSRFVNCCLSYHRGGDGAAGRLAVITEGKVWELFGSRSSVDGEMVQ